MVIKDYLQNLMNGREIAVAVNGKAACSCAWTKWKGEIAKEQEGKVCISPSMVHHKLKIGCPMKWSEIALNAGIGNKIFYYSYTKSSGMVPS